MSRSRSSLRLVTLALAAAAGLAGCGSGNGDEQAAARAAAPLLKYRAAVDAARANAKPQIKGPKLLEIRLTGQQFGTSDVATYGRDGSVVLIRAYGGGGYYALTCQLNPQELARLKRDIARLPLGRAPHVRERPRKTFYQLPAPSYVVEHGRYVGSFTADAVPKDGRPFMRHIQGLMHDREGRCSPTYGSRTR